jgi:2-polyprenyl-6-methoxyphenol hydroxylase-like FAD-dependent oxidoreductase
MGHERTFDVIVVGGGIAGASVGGVLARAGLGVLVVEKEARFRDRVRGEGTWPYGVADALSLRLGDVLHAAGAVPLSGIRKYENHLPVSTYLWSEDAVASVGAVGFSHPGLQETLFAWAASQGAKALRPAKAVTFGRNGVPTLTVVQDGQETEYAARLVIGADGKQSMARRWTGGQTVADPEHHRFGGVLVSGVDGDDRDTTNIAAVPEVEVSWFAAGRDHTRLYLRATAERLRRHHADRSFAGFLDIAAEYMPIGSLDHVAQAGPIGFFANSDTWASTIAGNGVVLVGDAAGAPDPSLGHGTALMFHDVRALTELLLDGADWEAATSQYAARRARYFAPLLAYDRWHCLLSGETGDEADRLREGHERAKAHDPTLGGYAFMEARGPDNLVADEAARRHYFGEDLD